MSQLQDTFKCGDVVVMNGKRYIIAEHSNYQTNGGISLNITAVAYENCEPMVAKFISNVLKPRKIKKSNRKVKSR